MDLRDVFTGMATLIAIYAAILSTLNFRRDRPIVKISARREMEELEIEGSFVAGETFTSVTVANTGRRPLTITDVCARRLFPQKGCITLPCNPKLQFELTENTQLKAFVDPDTISLDEVEAWEVHYAGGGKPYRMYVASRSTRMWSHLRSKWAKWTRVAG